MRRIGDASFFRIVDQLFGAGATPLNAARWTIDGVDWRRERHNYSGDSHGFTVEVTTGTSARKPSWNLIIVKEYWRKAEAGEGFKNSSMGPGHVGASCGCRCVAQAPGTDFRSIGPATDIRKIGPEKSTEGSPAKKAEAAEAGGATILIQINDSAH